MSAAPSPTPSTVTLEQLMALNDEMVALTRSGVPLGAGLAELGRDLPGQLGRIAQSIAQRLEQGANLADVLAADEGEFPPVYRAVVQAGLRTGRLAVALEGLATSIRRVMQLRQLMGLSLVYPLLVLVLACALFAWVVPQLTTELLASHQTQRVPATTGIVALAGLANRVGGWVMLIPATAVLLAVAWWWRSRRAISLHAGRGRALTSFLPQAGRFLRVGRTATFLEVLALLIEQQVPSGEALRLAAGASGDQRLIESADDLARRVEQGGTSAESSSSTGGIPPLVTWRILRPGSHEQLAKSLRHTADVYRRQTQAQADWLTCYLPLLLTVVIGGTATGIYVLCVFVPWLQFLVDMGRPL